jgi:hypothetical protein
MKNVFIHHVYFWLKHPENADDKQQLIEGLQKLSAASSIQSFHIGTPASTSRDVIDGSYAVSWLLVFGNKALQDEYQTDPVHLRFIKDCAHLWERVVVYDSVDV